MAPAVIAAIISGIAALASGTLNAVSTSSRNTQTREYDEKMLRLQNQWSLDQWNMTNQYNAPKEQVSRMYEAGLNPLYYGLDGSSAQAFQSAQPLAWNPDAIDFNSLANIGDIIADVPIKQKQLDLMDTQISKLKSETDSVELDNQFKRETLEAREEGIRLANEISKEQIKEIDTHRREMEANIHKLAEEAKTEEEKRALLKIQQNVAKAQEKEILTLLPLREQQIKANTLAQRAQAAAAFAAAAKDKAIYTDEYIEDLHSQAKEQLRSISNEADRKAAEAKLQNFVAACRTGDIAAINPVDGESRPLENALNLIITAISATGTAILSPIGSILK